MQKLEALQLMQSGITEHRAHTPAFAY